MIEQFASYFYSPSGGVIRHVGYACVLSALLWSALIPIASFAVKTFKKRSERHRAEQAGTLAIVATLVICVTLTLIVPHLYPNQDFVAAAILWIHRLGVGLLGDFLVAALFFQCAVWVEKRRSTTIVSLRKTYNRWLWITETMPAPAAIAISVTGFYRVFSVPGYSLAQPWIMALVMILSVMMADGIFSYTPAIRSLCRIANESNDIATFLKESKDPWRDFKLLVHSLSFPFVLIFPIWKFGENSTGGWPQLVPALTLFTVLFVAVASANRWRTR